MVIPAAVARSLFDLIRDETDGTVRHDRFPYVIKKHHGRQWFKYQTVREFRFPRLVVNEIGEPRKTYIAKKIPKDKHPLITPSIM
jgi:hypothetical protein